MKIRISSVAAIFLSVIGFLPSLKAQSLILSATASGSVPCAGGVTMPAYGLYIGCAPTADAMILAYYDLAHGDTNLFTIGGTNLYNGFNVKSAISALATDSTTTSGTTAPGNLIPGLKTYAAANGGYTFSGTGTRLSDSLSAGWTTLVNNINAEHPMIFYVDSDGDGKPDDFVPVIGYDTSHLFGDGSIGEAYACYNETADGMSAVWYKFETPVAGNQFDTYGITEDFTINGPSVPEPSTTTSFFVGIGALIYFHHRKKKIH